MKGIFLKGMWQRGNFNGKGGEVVNVKIMCFFIFMKGGNEVVRANKNNCEI